MKKTRLDCLPIEDRRNGEDTEQGITVSVTEHVSLRSLSRGGGGRGGLSTPLSLQINFLFCSQGLCNNLSN